MTFYPLPRRWELCRSDAPELKVKDTTESNTSASYLDFILSIGKDGQLRTSVYDKRDYFNFHITTSQQRPPIPFLSHNSSNTPRLAPLIMDVLF